MSNLLGYKDLPFEILNQINNVIDMNILVRQSRPSGVA